MSDKSIEEEIAEVKALLKEKEASQVSTAGTVAALTAKLEKLEKLQADIEKASEEYSKAYPDLISTNQEYDDYYHAEKRYLLESLSEADVAAVQKIVEEKRLALNEKKAAVDAANAAHDGTPSSAPDSAVKRRDAAKKALDDAKAAADKWTSPVASIRGRLSKLATRRDEVNKAQADSKNALAFWLLDYAGIPTKAGTDDPIDPTFAELLCAPPEIVEPSSLASRIRHAIDALNAADSAYQEAVAEEKLAMQAAAAAKADLAAFTREFEADTLKKIDEIQLTSNSQSAEATAAAPRGPADPQTDQPSRPATD